ncbi:MAG: hypothetical protein AB8B56_21245 [Crocinitomicaceae bacterium]
MKTNMSLIFALIVFIGCQTGEKSIEDNLYQCLVEQYDENDIDLAASLDSIEDHLIQVGILTSRDGQGRINYYQEIIKQGEVHYTPETPIMTSLRNSDVNMGQVIECIKNAQTFDSLKYYSSEFYLKSKKIADHVEASGATNPVNVSKAILANLTAADFEHPFYRAQLLITMVMTNERNKAYVRTVLKPTQPETKLGKGFVIDISVPDTFLVNDESAEKAAIEPALVHYLDTVDSSIFVRIKVSGKTLYGQLVEVQKLIRSAHKTFWNKVSLKTLNRSFDELTSNEKESIESEYPIRIIEEVVD